MEPIVPFWYANYETEWAKSGCLNNRPLPYNNIHDRPNYPSQLECCKAEYAGQESGICLSQLPNPPTVSPTDVGGADSWYPVGVQLMHIIFVMHAGHVDGAAADLNV